MKSMKRSIRRYSEEKIVIKRLKVSIYSYSFYRFRDINDIPMDNPYWFDKIGTSDAFFFKTNFTTHFATKGKNKWGKKGKFKSRIRWSDFYGVDTRVNDKRLFKRNLEKNGLKHFPTEYRSKLEDIEQYDLLFQ